MESNLEELFRISLEDTKSVEESGIAEEKSDDAPFLEPRSRLLPLLKNQPRKSMSRSNRKVSTPFEMIIGRTEKKYKMKKHRMAALVDLVWPDFDALDFIIKSSQYIRNNEITKRQYRQIRSTLQMWRYGLAPAANTEADLLDRLVRSHDQEVSSGSSSDSDNSRAGPSNMLPKNMRIEFARVYESMMKIILETTEISNFQDLAGLVPQILAVSKETYREWRILTPDDAPGPPAEDEVD